MATTLEFTIEPFVPAKPGPHVTESIAAAESIAGSVEVGPFGTTVSAPVEEIGTIAAAVIDAAMLNGASRVSLQVSIDPTR
jgi:uncharacterized protein YqgV (UPF0045/DUF77 family)